MRGLPLQTLVRKISCLAFAMMRRLSSLPVLIFSVIFLLTACSPTYDWREVRGSDAPYLAMLPGKPSTHTRTIDLNGIEISMTMTAAEVQGQVFAVASATLPDPAQAAFALEAMKTALVKNINGTVRVEKKLPSLGQPPVPVLHVEAVGTPSGEAASSQMLLARFMAKDQRIYQILVIGPETKVDREQAETFLAGFKVQ